MFSHRLFHPFAAKIIMADCCSPALGQFKCLWCALIGLWNRQMNGLNQVFQELCEHLVGSSRSLSLPANTHATNLVWLRAMKKWWHGQCVFLYWSRLWDTQMPCFLLSNKVSIRWGQINWFVLVLAYYVACKCCLYARARFLWINSDCLEGMSRRSCLSPMAWRDRV